MVLDSYIKMPCLCFLLVRLHPWAEQAQRLGPQCGAKSRVEKHIRVSDPVTVSIYSTKQPHETEYGILGRVFLHISVKWSWYCAPVCKVVFFLAYSTSSSVLLHIKINAQYL